MYRERPSRVSRTLSPWLSCSPTGCKSRYDRPSDSAPVSTHFHTAVIKAPVLEHLQVQHLHAAACIMRSAPTLPEHRSHYSRRFPTTSWTNCTDLVN